MPLLTLSVLLSFTTFMYQFNTPSTISVRQRHKEGHPPVDPSCSEPPPKCADGSKFCDERQDFLAKCMWVDDADSPPAPFWGVVDSDFDWCERNHDHSPHVAEPWNVVTSASYPLMALVTFRRHSRVARRGADGSVHHALSVWHALMLSVTGVMGIGSMIFHATLRYQAQLLDELPLYAMAVLAAAALWQRGRREAGAQSAAAAWAVLLSYVLAWTERFSAVHELFRGAMTVSFSAAFLYIFTVGSVVGAEIDRERGGHDGARLFRSTFALFVGAVVAWILDIVACPQLQGMRLPYPQLHAVGWHLGTCLGLLQLFALMLLHQHTVRDGFQAQVEWGWMRLVPRLKTAGPRTSAGKRTNRGAPHLEAIGTHRWVLVPGCAVAVTATGSQ